jgi:hypothetical protein
MVRARCRKLEGAQGLKLAVERVDLAFQPRDLGVGHFEPAARVLGLVGETKIGAEIEQIVLNAREHGVEGGMALSGMEARNADGGVGLVERAIGLDPEVVFRHTPAGTERGRAVVAGARVNLRENYHCARLGKPKFRGSCRLCHSLAQLGAEGDQAFVRNATCRPGRLRPSRGKAR